MMQALGQTSSPWATPEGGTDIDYPAWLYSTPFLSQIPSANPGSSIAQSESDVLIHAIADELMNEGVSTRTTLPPQ